MTDSSRPERTETRIRSLML